MRPTFIGFNPCRQSVHIRGRDIIMGWEGKGREGRGGPWGVGMDFSFDGILIFGEGRGGGLFF